MAQSSGGRKGESPSSPEPESRREHAASGAVTDLVAEREAQPSARRPGELERRNVAVYWIEREAIELRRLQWSSDGAQRELRGQVLRDKYGHPAPPKQVPRGKIMGHVQGLWRWFFGGGAPVSDSDSHADRNCPIPPPSAPPVRNLVGLALSGGGIRSASFNLGVLQGLQSRSALWIFDYLSTVSGGGFIGSWWSAWLSRERRPPGDIFPDAEELEPQRRTETAVLLHPTGSAPRAPSIPDGSLIARRRDPIHFVRLFSNYLTPKKGAFSPDTWRLIAVFVRNLLFTWMALLPLLLAAVIAGQAFYLADARVAQAFLCPQPPGAQPAPAVPAAVSVYCSRYDQATQATASRGERLRYLGKPMLLLLAAYATLSLLWLAHSSARVGLALFAFGVLLFLGGVVIRPMFVETGSPGVRWDLIAVVGVTVLVHVWHTFQEYRRVMGNAEAGGDTVAHAAAADHRTWLTQQQALLLKVGTFAGFLLLIAGFGHDVIWYLFVGGDSVLARGLARAGGWGGLLLAIGTAAYTAFTASPSGEGAAPAPVGPKSRLVMALAPPLVLLAFTLGFALLSHGLLARTMTVPRHILLLSNAVVWLAVLELLFAMYESYSDPVSPPDEGTFSWRRFVPDPVLRLIGQRAPPPAEKRPFFNLFSPRAWVRLGVVGACATVVGWAENPSFRSIGSAITSFPTTAVAVGILAVATLVTFARRDWDLALGSARPAGLMMIASVTAALCLLTNGSIATRLQADALLGALLWIGLLVGGVIGIGWLADPNLLSLHSFYKARLTRAYLGASNTNRKYDEITDAAPGDELKLTALWNHDAGGPYHLINTTLSLVGGSDLATSQRSAENFVMSRYHCGSARSGYRCTAEYMSGELSLGTAAAISGAAVSPNMGPKSPSAALALLLSLLNVRLGFWAPTPSGRRWNEPHARLWPFYLLRETLSNTGTLGTYCYLTDGGHFDNTGVYALVERACRYIVVCDCGADPHRGFEDIGVAIRRCRIDFGAEVDLPVDAFATLSADETTATHVVRGTITYQRAHLKMLGIDPDADAGAMVGTIVWIKPSVTALDAADVRQYHLAHRDFPQQSTAEQWYDESQFESYRRLGYESARRAFPNPAATAVGDFGEVGDWFLEVGAAPQTPPPVG